MRYAALVAVVALVVGCASGPKELTQEHRDAAAAELKARGLDPPQALTLSSVGFVTEDYEIPDTQARRARQIGEARLLAIREGLIKFGFTDYRVNVNGPSPGTGLTRRYGSARFIGGGSLEWKTP